MDDVGTGGHNLVSGKGRIGSIDDGQTRGAIVLDGPSAVALYRDRDDLTKSLHNDYSASARADQITDELDDFWLSDEDVAASLAEENVFGSLAMTETEEYLAATSAGKLPRLERSNMVHLRDAISRSSDLKRIPYEALGLRPPSECSPLYLLVPQADRRRRVKHVRQRLFGAALPRHSFARIGTEVYVPTPELTFLLMAHYLSLHELVVLGMELCGHYRLAGANTENPLKSNRTIYSQASLTTPQRLSDYLDHVEYVWGLSLAKQACAYLAADSASPMETALYVLLCLPRNLGGYGFPRPLLNVRRRVTVQAKRVTLSKTLFPDLFWPEALLDLEYDSEEFHASTEHLRNGAIRTLALRTMNVEVIAATKEMIYDVDTFDALAKLVAKSLGIRARKPGERGRMRREQLRSIVLT